MGRLRVTLKLATSLDGKIALSNGQSEWVTGPKARQAGRRLRAEHDAIAVGSNTAVLDNPQLTTRIGDLPNPSRVVFDTRLRVSPDSNLALSARDVPTIVLTRDAETEAAQVLKGQGVTVLPVPLDGDHVSVSGGVDALSRMGVESLLVEGGGHLAAAFLKAGLVDRLEWFTAPILIGGDGRACVAGLALSDMADVVRFERVALRELDADLHESFERV